MKDRIFSLLDCNANPFVTFVSPHPAKFQTPFPDVAKCCKVLSISAVLTTLRNLSTPTIRHGPQDEGASLIPMPTRCDLQQWWRPPDGPIDSIQQMFVEGSWSSLQNTRGQLRNHITLDDTFRSSFASRPLKLADPGCAGCVFGEECCCAGGHGLWEFEDTRDGVVHAVGSQLDASQERRRRPLFRRNRCTVR